MKWTLDYATVNKLICKALKLRMKCFELSVLSTSPNMEKWDFMAVLTKSQYVSDRSWISNLKNLENNVDILVA